MSPHTTLTIDPRFVERLGVDLLADDVALGRAAAEVAPPDAGVVTADAADAAERVVDAVTALRSDLRGTSDALGAVSRMTGGVDHHVSWLVDLLAAELER